jgi:integrase/recombinase XerC/integrase/recombinase XerD
MTAVVRQLHTATARPLAGAIATYLTVGLAGAEHDRTRRVYGGILRRLAGQFGEDTPAADLEPDAVAEWFAETWASAAPSTWNVALGVIRSAGDYWTEQGWADANPAARLRRRRTPPDRDRALSRARLEQLLTEEKIPLRERLFWRMAYETAARSGELLRLNVEDLDLANRRARVVRKGGAVDVVIWQTGTARLLPRYLRGRASGPLFVTERRARDPQAMCDLDAEGRARLSYEQAAMLFKKASGGGTLHQLRHSALTHDAEEGTSTPMLMARSGHTSVRSLAKYARVSAEALQRHQEARDPARRR